MLGLARNIMFYLIKEIMGSILQNYQKLFETKNRIESMIEDQFAGAD